MTGLAATVALGWWFAGGESAAPMAQAAGNAPSSQQSVPSAQASNKSTGANKQKAAAVEAHPATPELFKQRVQPFFRQYCLDCHGEEEPEGGFSLASLQQPDDVTDRRDQFDKVLKLLSISAMPPLDHDPMPTDAERKVVMDWLDAKLYYVNCELKHDAGRVTIRRLNRAEYDNTIRDLLGVTIDVTEDFPSDDVGNGFDNIGDVLTLPPLLLEKYMDASEAVAAAAITTPEAAQRARLFEGSKLAKDGSANLLGNGFWSMPSSGSVHCRPEIDYPGRYAIRIEAAADQAGDELAKMQLRIDGQPAHVFEIKGYRKPGFYEHTVQLKAGQRRIEAAFINDYYNPKAENPRERDRNLAVRSIELKPLDAPPPDANPNPLITARPDGKALKPRDAARQVFANLLPRAFRRPVNPDEVDRIVTLVDFALSNGESYERAIQVGLQGVLVSPHFLFRVEIDERPDDAQEERRLNAYELASRLSYFLWSSMPDERLFELAESGRLLQRDVQVAEIERMLDDPKSQALIDNFAAQWLNLRNLQTITPDPEQFGTFDDELRESMVEETLQFARAIMDENRSVLDFLDADFTFVNERLAKHYGIEGVTGDEFQRVKLTSGRRAGVLTHASILTLTSNPARTSPVKRGKWVLENILGTPPPPAPPNVPELEVTAKASPNASLREQLKLHRADPGCASCHTTMDAIGFGFENFDAIGRWREKDGQFDIDSAGELPGGDRYANAVELVRILKKQDRKFARSLAEKMLTYALGRGLEYYDRCTLDTIVDEMHRHDYRFSILVREIVLSKAFQMRRGDSGVPQ